MILVSARKTIGYPNFLVWTFIGLAMAVFVSSCAKEPEIIIQTETITVTDTLVVVDTLTVLDTLIQTVSDTATTFILVRHAETTGGGSNPILSMAGEERAIELSRVLGNTPLSAVFSTSFNRTLQTAAPTSADQGLITETYNPSGLEAFVDDILALHQEGIILVVGHSNTTPDILNILVGDELYSDLSETAYDNLFVVTVFEKGRAEVIHMKYGQ